MTGAAGWHLDGDLLVRYVDGRVDAATGSSVEQHLVRCEQCRTGVNVVAGSRPEAFHLDDVWARLEEDLQAPRCSPVERLLTRLGMSADDVLLIWAAPAFRAPWLAATLVTLAFATFAAVVNDHRGLMLFLVVAPLLPVAGVALSYGPDADPAFEVGLATPYPALRLALLRTLAVLATTVPLTVAAGLLLPGHNWVAVAWLAPCLTAVAATMALSTWLSVTRSAIVVSCVWAAFVSILAGPGVLAPTVALAPAGLPGYALLAAISLAVVWVRGSHLNHLGDHA
jgi:hypothetical protein